MSDLQSRALIAATNNEAPIEAKANTSDWPSHVNQCPLADPVCRIPEGDDGVRATRRKKPSSGLHLDGEAR